MVNAILPIRQRIVATLLLFQPPVQRGEQTRVIWKARFLHGSKREPLRRRIKGGGNGDGYLLGVELEARAPAPQTWVPRCAKVF